MKKLYRLIVVAFCAILLTACKKEVQYTNSIGITIGTAKNESALYLSKDETGELLATVINTDNKSVTWSSSDETVATVNNVGKVTAIGAGTAMIKATCIDNHFYTFPVNVRGIVIDESISLGKDLTKTATIIYGNFTDRYKKTTITAGTSTIATIDTTGRITAKGIGTTTLKIVVKDNFGEYTRNIDVTVTAYTAVVRVSLNQATLLVKSGESTTLTATVAPSTATNNFPVWSSSNTAIATVDNTGKVTGVGSGVTTVTITVDGKMASCSVIVTTGTPILVETVSLNKSNVFLNIGDTEQLTATVLPSNAIQEITWSSSDEKIITVTSGKIIAIAAGTATITVKSAEGGKTGTCNVMVAPKTVESINLNKTALSLGNGLTEILVATILPPTATNKKVIWTSDAVGIATIDNTGKITIKAETGTATITATTDDGGFIKTCVVTALPQPVTSITLNKATLSLDVGVTEPLTATLVPATAITNKVWLSSNTNVATVDNTGVVTAIAKGTATITVITDNNNKSSTCTVTVK